MRILAVITSDSSKVGGGAPIFFAQNQEEAEKLGAMVSAIFGAAVHDLNNGVLIIVKH
ncbi:MAG: hypothetical protein GX101_04040 [Firmicutes bacterium]|jgi:hypothetical protein|nr:hypothetical protein [Bacillota bacterium]NLO65841.1 hypothetical protein [Bacillota bacterium]